MSAEPHVHQQSDAARARTEFVEWCQQNEAALLRAMSRRMASRLRRALDPRDLLQDVLIAALRSLDSSPWAKASADGERRAWMHTLVRRRAASAARATRARCRPRRTGSIPDALRCEDADERLATLAARPDSEPAARAQSDELGCERQERGGRALRLDERIVLGLRERFTVDWPTIAFLLERRVDAVRMLHLRATRRTALE